MNTKKLTTRWEEGGVSNERIPPNAGQVLIVRLEEENEEVLRHEPQVAPEPQEPQVTHMPQYPFVEEDMTNAELRASLMNFTQLMTAQAQVITNHLVA